MKQANPSSLVFWRHPVYSHIGATEEGHVYNLETRHFLGNLMSHGYVYVSIRNTTFPAHRIIWECCTGEMLPMRMVIDHFDKIRDHNFIENLQMVTQKENSRRIGPRAKKVANSIWVIATDPEGVEITYESCLQAGQALGINPSSIHKCVSRDRKSAFTTTGLRYKFRSA
jgi:hypothetical protein